MLSCIVILTLSAQPTNRTEMQVDPELQVYADRFIEESIGYVTKEDLDTLQMKFKVYSPGSSTAGTCYPFPGLEEIYINKEWWDDNESDIRREQLVFHELAHCILLRKHTAPTSASNFWGFLEKLAFALGIFRNPGLLPDDCPISIMHPETIGDYCLEKHYGYYLDELYGFTTPEEYIEQDYEY